MLVLFNSRSGYQMYLEEDVIVLKERIKRYIKLISESTKMNDNRKNSPTLGKEKCICLGIGNAILCSWWKHEANAS